MRHTRSACTRGVDECMPERVDAGEGEEGRRGVVVGGESVRSLVPSLLCIVFDCEGFGCRGVVVAAISVSILWISNLWLELFRKRMSKLEKKVE